jgi:hypothetical protein
MGYTTEFSGKFNLNKRLDDETYNLLVGLAATRRMKRNMLNYGVDGEFYVGSRENFGQNDDPTIVDRNTPPRTQPGLWCQWVPTKDGMSIEWDGNEKFYYYTEWIKYLIKSILGPRGYILNGTVSYQGEDSSDNGEIIITNNIVERR